MPQQYTADVGILWGFGNFFIMKLFSKPNTGKAQRVPAWGRQDTDPG
jgi:hypothetical protein